MEQKIITKKSSGAKWYVYENGKLCAGFKKSDYADIFIDALKNRIVNDTITASKSGGA